MEADHPEPKKALAGPAYRAFPVIIAPEQDPSQERLLQRTANDNEQPSRFKSLHRPRTYSASSYASQPDEPPVSHGHQPYPDERGRRSFQNETDNAYYGHGGYVAVQGASRSLWVPFWLSKIVLIGLLLLFAGLLIALLLLWYANNERNGFYVADSTSSYTWTYGPTTLLVILVSFWRMVDYHCKTLTPWFELRNGPVVASRSVRLDYLSPLQLLSLWKALGNGHIAVVATVVGFILLKAMTIFSTGLFVLNTIPFFNSGFSVNTTTKFDPKLSSAFNGTSALDVTSSPVYSWYATMVNGLPDPPGLSDTYAYQTFEPTQNSPINASIATVVDALVVSPQCRVISVKVDGPTSIQGLNLTHAFSSNLSLILPDGEICQHWSTVSVPVQDPQHYIVPTKQITGTYQGVYCSLTSNGSRIDLSKGPDAYLYTLTDVRYKQKVFANATNSNHSSVITYANSTSRTLKGMSNVLCSPTYTLTQINVTNTTSASLNGRPGQTKLTQLPHAENRTLIGFSARNLSSVFTATVGSASNLFGVVPTNSSSQTSARQVPSTIFSLMAATRKSQDFSIFLDATILKSAAEQVFNGVSLQVAHRLLMSPDDTEVASWAVYPQNKLYIRPISLWIMAGCLGILVFLTILVLVFAPAAVVSRDPGSIGAHAAILARSTDFNRELRKEGAIQDGLQRSILSPHAYKASVLASDSGPPVFKIQVQPGGRPDALPSKAMPMVEWFSPITMSSPVLLSMVVLPAGAIATLELLQRYSESHGGLLTLPEGRFDEAYIHYIPALVMLSIATLFNILDFNVAIFAPFSLLQSGYAKSRRTIMSHLLGKMPPFAVYEAIMSRQVGALFSLFGALIASVLTIIVSGLYSVELLSSNGPIRGLAQLDTFNLTWNNSYAFDNGAAATLSLVEHMNLSYPVFTYEELVFPSLALGNLDGAPTALSVISGPSTATIPALRGNLDCQILKQSEYTISIRKGNFSGKESADEVVLSAEFNLPSECQLAGKNRNSVILNYVNTFQPGQGGEAIYAGAQLDLLFGNGTNGTNYGETNGQSIPDNVPGCPSLAFTFGLFKINSSDRSKVTTMVCHQQIQQVVAEVTFLANSTTIDTTRPPVVDETSVKLLTNPVSASGSTSFEYRIQQNLANEFATFNGQATETVDVFYQGVINGIQKVQEDSLVGESNHNRLLNATNHFYRKYMAQVINANMRKLCPATGCPSDLISKRQASSSNFQATTSVTRPRLVQSATSKLVLQILLGTMLSCGIIAYIATPMRRVLPCNPCTIAGTMALLAGSKICWSSDENVCECCGKGRSHDADHMIQAYGEVDHHEDRVEIMPHGAEWMSDKELRKVFVNLRYSLGWWRRGYGDKNKGNGTRYGIDIGRADGLDDQDWSLGRKRTRRYTDEERAAHVQKRQTRVPNWLLGPLKEPESEAETPQAPIAKQLSDHQIRQSRLPEWMLGPLRPDGPPDAAQQQDHQSRERKAQTRPGLSAEEEDISSASTGLLPSPLRSGPRHSRIPNWLLGPLKPDVESKDAYARPGEGQSKDGGQYFASGGLRGSDVPADFAGVGDENDDDFGIRKRKGHA